MVQKPVAPFVLSLLGGLLIALVALAIDAIVFNVLALFLGILGFAFGATIVYNAVMLYLHPKEHFTRGIVIVILSVLSIFTALGGFLVGLILGVIGGALAIQWEPHPTPYYTPPPEFQTGYVPYGPHSLAAAGVRPGGATPPNNFSESGNDGRAGFCTNCGVALPSEARFCPACGARVAPY